MGMLKMYDVERSKLGPYCVLALTKWKQRATVKDEETKVEARRNLIK